MRTRSLTSLSFVLIISILVSFSALLQASDKNKYKGPIADGHAHIGGDLDFKVFIKAIDEGGVTRAVVWPHGRPFKDRDTYEFYETYPDRIVPTIGFVNRGWREQRSGFMNKVRKKAASGKYLWMGEIVFRGKTTGPLHVHPSSKYFGELLESTKENNLPITIHHANIRAKETKTLLEKLRNRPDAVVIWAHWCGTSKPEIVREWLSELPNLHCDLAWHHRDSKTIPEPLKGSDNLFLPTWIELMEEFPDRFLVGMDAKTNNHYGNKYRNRVNGFRKALGQLSPKAAEKIAHLNFERILRKAPQ